MMLNRVDLPQPDGPITARNSPGETVNDMRSTATRGPSGVSKRLETLSTARIASAGPIAEASWARACEVAAVAMNVPQLRAPRVSYPVWRVIARATLGP